jgi:hypothetical protein
MKSPGYFEAIRARDRWDKKIKNSVLSKVVEYCRFRGNWRCRRWLCGVRRGLKYRSGKLIDVLREVAVWKDERICDLEEEKKNGLSVRRTRLEGLYGEDVSR